MRPGTNSARFFYAISSLSYINIQIGYYLLVKMLVYPVITSGIKCDTA